MFRVAASGAFSRKSMNVLRPSAKRAEQESSAADVARERIGDGQREADGYRGVDRVSARLQHAQTNVGGQRLLRHHHRVSRMLRLARRQANRQEQSHSRS